MPSSAALRRAGPPKAPTLNTREGRLMITAVKQGTRLPVAVADVLAAGCHLLPGSITEAVTAARRCSQGWGWAVSCGASAVGPPVATTDLPFQP
jgi:hypothetical protein